MQTNARTEGFRQESTDVVLEVTDGRVTFDMARGRSRVVNDVDLSIRRGETLAIVGESGSGKSTLGAMLVDAVQDPGTATGGVHYYPGDGRDPIEILDAGDRTQRQIRWEEISIVSQAATNAFNPTIPIRRHFTDTFVAHDVPREEGLDRAREVLADLDLDPDTILDAHQHELSGGQKQRAQLALSLVLDPEVVILDEPTAGLDLIVQRNFLSLIYEIKEEYNFTLVLISHDMPVVSGLADRIAVMYAFEIVERGEAREILLSPEHPYTRLMTRAHLGAERDTDEVKPIAGDPPDSINVPTGCPFHPRCPVADDRCEVEDPELRGADGRDHEVACFYPTEAVESIPHSVIDPGGETE